MLQVGDVVDIFNSAECEVCGVAWAYIKAHPQATIKALVPLPENHVYHKGDQAYVLEWPEDFPGGHTCNNVATPRRGQFVSERHIDINFEATYLAQHKEINTVPNIRMTIDEQGDGMPKVQE